MAKNDVLQSMHFLRQYLNTMENGEFGVCTQFATVLYLTLFHGREKILVPFNITGSWSWPLKQTGASTFCLSPPPSHLTVPPGQHVGKTLKKWEMSGGKFRSLSVSSHLPRSSRAKTCKQSTPWKCWKSCNSLPWSRQKSAWCLFSSQ